MIFLLSIPLLIGPILFLCFVAYGYAVRASAAEKRANRAEGALDESRGYGEKMRDLAAQAIGLAHEKYFPADDKHIGQTGTYLDLSKATYVAPEVGFCVCHVSVRSESWPVPCPACGKPVGDDPTLDADLIG